MRMILRTKVEQPYQQVWEGFNRELFLKLNPPFPPVRLLRFDGCREGNVVQLELNFGLFRERWDSLITKQQSDAEEISFVDEGQRLPFFLRYWHHHHLEHDMRHCIHGLHDDLALFTKRCRGNAEENRENHNL